MATLEVETSDEGEVVKNPAAVPGKIETIQTAGLRRGEPVKVRAELAKAKRANRSRVPYQEEAAGEHQEKGGWEEPAALKATTKP